MAEKARDVDDCTLLSFGEAMIRYKPVESKTGGSEPSVFLRSVGGDELNVCVAQAKLGRKTQWVSVLPSGPMGKVVLDSAENVDTSRVIMEEDGDVGTFTVLPQLKTVHYQRRNSAFARHDPDCFNWNELLTDAGVKTWLHVTGITPMISKPAFESWNRALHEAHKLFIPTSLDFNHRKQLGSLQQLWKYVQPHLNHLQVIVISLVTLQELAVQEGVPTPNTSLPASDPRWVQLMQTLRSRWNVKRLACCFKTVDKGDIQTRWSVMCTENGVISTHALPVLHKPMDALGGGSAWMAGLLDAFMTHGSDHCDVSFLRHADLLAALCQETQGDHSTVTHSQLDEVESLFSNKTVDLTLLPQKEDVLIKASLEHLISARVIGIIRAKNADAAIQRGLELCRLGCRAVEVTTDTTDAVRVVSELSRQLPPSCLLGVGTIMDSEQMSIFSPLGVKFALSPISPSGFIEACHSRGVLAVPSGLTANELWSLHCQGAKLIKLFHAGTISPAILKSMLGVGPLKDMNIIPSGGITPQNVDDWLNAGARVVGLGSNLVGKDINFPTGSTDYTASHREWEETGREAAKRLFTKAAS
ncbi:uncharacterized protein LOC134196491 [Corticium candelabrum]|uniref:uncharacterized protein LOC134196491 n=1 Tax=Corticium candelabrum TaxID=121492 RepID=UPI002E2722EB|nr:uncharacterized protein LOC134196491 [Corticium candelabrum]